jgi:hypothetical protein
LGRRLLLVAAVCAVVCAPLARADGDPASDYLLSQSVFIPPDIGVPSRYQKQLTDLLTNAKARGYETRVALIGTRYDMGLITDLFHQPKRYSRFLGQELFFVYKGRLLVVMPNGFGATRGGNPAPADQAIVDRLPAPGKNGVALASSATRAVVRLAAASGVVVAVPPLRGSTGSSRNRDRLVILIGAAALLALAGLATLAWRRFRS